MELNFIKDNNKYVSEFEVSSDFNLHIERNEGGTLYIQQRTGNGQYDTVKDAVFKLGDSVIDYDFQALVYPKYIKIVSDINPIAYITSDGEVTEIKSQTKEVEVTANGTTQVAPDAGYSYLTGVTVKTNVPQSGGSGDAPSQPSGGSRYEYYDVSNVSAKLIFIEIATLVKTSDDITTLGLNLSFNKTLTDVVDSINAVAIDKDCKMLLTMDETPEFMTVGEFFAMSQSSTGANLTPITEEEFYNLES